MPIYQMSIFRMPKSVARRVEKSKRFPLGVKFYGVWFSLHLDLTLDKILSTRLIRPASLLMVPRVQDGSSKLKLQIGVRNFSSAASSHMVLGMPALSPTMTQGNIAKWRKKREIRKATLEFESLEEGFLAKILVAEGSKDVPVGQPIAITVEDEEDIQKVPASVAGGSGVEEKSKHENAGNEDKQQETSSTINTQNFLLILFLECQHYKATLEFESLEEGYLLKIVAPEGSKDVAVGQPIAITVEDPDDIEIVKASVSSGSDIKKEKPQQQESRNEVRAEKSSFTRISPSAKLLITESGLDASTLKASGPRYSAEGISSSKDKMPPPPVHSQASPSASPERSHLQQSESFEDMPNSQIIRLLESKQNTPHLYLSSDVILDPLLSFRKELKEKHDVKVSVNDIVIKAKGEVILSDSVDISIAVATEKVFFTGLDDSIVRNADQKTISSISIEVKELAEKATRAGKASNEFQGGTFSISNLGMFPVDHFCAIINPPQSGILAVGRGNKVVEPVVEAMKPAVVTKMNLTLSADHRVFDGKVGGAFLSALCSNFSDIRRLLL
ncbi:hypothetical protein AAG906_014539 [Vitis piasezkii]